MNHKNKYRLAQNEAQKRLTELSQSNTADLRDELGLCRLLIESAVDQQSPAAIALLQTAAKLSQADLQNKIRSRDLLERDEAMQFAKNLCSIVADEIVVLPGFEDVLVRIAERIEEAMKARPRLEDHTDD
ncbi:MAG TPA: hypothetical protein VIH42_15240 [Thermoguttaceae bacterium]